MEKFEVKYFLIFQDRTPQTDYQYGVRRYSDTYPVMDLIPLDTDIRYKLRDFEYTT